MKIPQVLSRRDFLTLGGAAALSLLSSACGLTTTPTTAPANTPSTPEAPGPTRAISSRNGTLADALIYYTGYATEDALPWIERFDVDVLLRGFLLFSNTNEGWVSSYRAQMEQCQDERRLFLVGMQAAVLVAEGRDLPQIEPDDPALAVPMDAIPQWQEYACRTPQGSTLKEQGLPFAHACINNASFREFFQTKLQMLIDSGADGVHIDELPTRYFTMHEGYCDACVTGLRDYLAQKYTPAELASKYGISDIGAFDFRDQLATEGNLETPLQSPLHKEWWLFQLVNLAQVEQEVLSFCKSYAGSKGREFIVNGNAFEPEHEPKHIVEMTLTDFASMGTGMTIDLRKAGKLVSTLRIPPSYSYTPLYRMAQGVMPGRPVTLFIDGPGGANTMRELPEQRQKDIVRWMFAEAYAAGARFHVPYPSVGYYAPLEECQQYTRFIGQWRQIYEGTSHLAEVGVLFSYASQVWDYWAEVSSAEPNYNRQWYGLAQALTDMSVQYDVLFAPDGQIVPDGLLLDDLLRYETLIVPWAYSLNDAQVGLLADYAKSGKSLFIVGDFATYDADKNQRPTLVVANLERLGTTVLPALDLEVYLNDPQGSDAASILDALSALFPSRLVTISDPSVTAQLDQSADALYCHLINKALDDSGFQPRRDFTAQISLPPGASLSETQATFVSPDMAEGESIQLPITLGDNVAEITIPTLDIYGILMLPGAGYT